MIKIEFPDGSIGVASPFGDKEVDDLIRMVRPLINGNAYVKFLDECLEHIQEFLDWEYCMENSKEIVMPVTQSFLAASCLLTDPFQNYEAQSVRATRCSAGDFGAMRRVHSESKSLLRS